jgi:hypothetical protein
METNKLILFVKAPRPDFVKSRLAATIGPDEAATAYRRLVAMLLASLGAVGPVEIRFTPDDGAGEVEPWRKEGWTLRPQGEGDLGIRLHQAFSDSFADGFQRVVVIGSDCPTVTEADVRAAWSALESHDVVLGPAKDGGYWLIGLRAPQPALFDRMEWSTETVFRETLRRAKDAGLCVHRLSERTDIDTAEDWREFQAAFASGSEAAES